MVHPGKRDWWIAGLLSLVAAVNGVAGAWLIGVALVGRQYPALFPGTVMALAATMVTWILRGTSYEITDTSLIIRCGPFRKTVPLDAIAEVVPAGAWGGPVLEVNYALAVRSLRVRYRKPSGRLSWAYRIAPRDRAAFLLELAEKQPALEVKDDGSLHRPEASGVTE
jgi:hypothetical protein